MSDPLGFYLLAALAIFAVTLGAIGLKRGKLVSVFPASRERHPGLFWYGVIFQLLMGGICLILAIYKFVT